ncbi:hypothetical protein HDZ31DRAFT_62402 [Schizophyllum fasciatum]
MNRGTDAQNAFKSRLGDSGQKIVLLEDAIRELINEFGDVHVEACAARVQLNENSARYNDIVARLNQISAEEARATNDEHPNDARDEEEDEFLRQLREHRSETIAQQQAIHECMAQTQTRVSDRYTAIAGNMDTMWAEVRAVQEARHVEAGSRTTNDARREGRQFLEARGAPDSERDSAWSAFGGSSSSSPSAGDPEELPPLDMPAKTRPPMVPSFPVPHVSRAPSLPFPPPPSVPPVPIHPHNLPAPVQQEPTPQPPNIRSNHPSAGGPSEPIDDARKTSPIPDDEWQHFMGLVKNARRGLRNLLGLSSDSGTSREYVQSAEEETSAIVHCPENVPPNVEHKKPHASTDNACRPAVHLAEAHTTVERACPIITPMRDAVRYASSSCENSDAM